MGGYAPTVVNSVQTCSEMENFFVPRHNTNLVVEIKSLCMY